MRRQRTTSCKVLTDLPGLDVRPLEALDIQADGGEGREQDDSLETRLLSLIVLRLRSPVQEGRNVLGQLRGGCGCAYDEIDSSPRNFALNVKKTYHRHTRRDRRRSHEA